MLSQSREELEALRRQLLADLDGIRVQLEEPERMHPVEPRPLTRGEYRHWRARAKMAEAQKRNDLREINAQLRGLDRGEDLALLRQTLVVLGRHEVDLAPDERALLDALRARLAEARAR